MDTAEALDLSKENIQPLKQGRNAVQLGAALQAQTNTEVYQQLTNQREKFELEIRMYEGDDPLQPRYEYVAWLEQSYPKHGPESNLIPLLEDTLTTYKDDDRYKQDPRYVELLVKYFDTQPNPLELYQVIYNQGLGTMCALFYRAWADEFDKNNDMLRADQIYHLGIKNRAQPLDELIEDHKQFQLSVGRRALGYADNYVEEPDSYSREALGRLKNKNKVPSIRDHTGPVGTWPLASNNSNLKPPNQRMKGSVKVYQECSNNENFPSGIMATGGMFPTHSAMHKENSLKPGPWSGQSRRSKHVPKPPTTPTFQVHEDEGEIEDQPQRPAAIVPRALKQRKPDTFTCPLAFFEPPDPTKQAMYCKHKVYVGGREFQFEELRAAEYMKRMEQKRLEFEAKQNVEAEEVAGNFKNEDIEEEALDDILKTPTINSNQEVIVENHLEQIATEETKPQPVFPNQVPDVQMEPVINEEMSLPEESEPVRLLFPEKRQQCQRFGIRGLLDANTSLTVNTKAAMNLVQEMWGSPSPVQVPIKQRKTGTFLPSADKNGDVFKVPAVPRPKIPPFSLYIDEDAATPAFSDSENQADTNKVQRFPVFSDDDLAQSNCPVVNNEVQNKIPSTFPIYTDDFEKDEYHCSSYSLLGDKTKKELHHIESCESKKPPVFQSKPLLGLINDIIEPTAATSENRRESLYSLGNLADRKSLYPPSMTKENPALTATNNIPSKCLVYTDDPANQMQDKSDKLLQLETQLEPLARLIPDQTPTQKQQNKITSSQENFVTGYSPFQRPQVFQEDIDGDLTNETCNTKAFAFALPSSTPMMGHFQSSASNQGVNISYIVEELQPKTGSVATHQELSKILEASNEPGAYSSSSSSSNGTGKTQHSQNSELNEKQKLTQISSEEIAEIEESIGTINLSGDIDPFSPELTSRLLSFIGYPRQCHLPRLHQVDKDLNTLAVNSTVTLDSIKYKLQSEIGKGAYARVLKATRDDKFVALKHQKPACVWELYIAQELQLRLRKMKSNMIGGFMEITNAFIFRNATVFETEYAAYGSLLNVVNTVKQKTGTDLPMDIVVTISIQLISILEHLHKCNIIHGDVKPDNFILTALPLHDNPNKPFVKLIDFGRSIDMALLPSGTTFTTVVTTDGFTCTEMLDKKPWTYQAVNRLNDVTFNTVQVYIGFFFLYPFQKNVSFWSILIPLFKYGIRNIKLHLPSRNKIDTYGLAGTIVLMLLGDYMKVVKCGDKWQLSQRIPRYHSGRNLWQPIISSLLNAESCKKQANLEEHRKSLQTYLASVDKFGFKMFLNKFANALNGK